MIARLRGFGAQQGSTGDEFDGRVMKFDEHYFSAAPSMLPGASLVRRTAPPPQPHRDGVSIA